MRFAFRRTLRSASFDTVDTTLVSCCILGTRFDALGRFDPVRSLLIILVFRLCLCYMIIKYVSLIMYIMRFASGQVKISALPVSEAHLHPCKRLNSLSAAAVATMEKSEAKNNFYDLVYKGWEQVNRPFTAS